MKRKIPAPLKEMVPGDPEPIHPPPIPTEGPEFGSPFMVERKKDFKEAQAKLRSLLAKGIGPRAVVCIKHVSLDEKTDPKMWGIVLRVNPFDQYPIQIHWCDGMGRVVYMDETDLLVIYPTITIDEMKEWLASERAAGPLR